MKKIDIMLIFSVAVLLFSGFLVCDVIAESCVTGRTFNERGRIRAEITNNCSGSVNIRYCFQRTNGGWSCFRRDNTRAGETIRTATFAGMTGRLAWGWRNSNDHARIYIPEVGN